MTSVTAGKAVAVAVLALACAHQPERARAPACPPLHAIEAVRGPGVWIDNDTKAPFRSPSKELATTNDLGGARSNTDPSPATCGGLPPSALGITEIAIEKTACYGECPIYTLVLRSDGSVEYFGTAHVRPLGHRSGTLAPVLFSRLACLATDIGFFNLSDRYRIGETTDSPSVFLAVTRNGTKKIVVTDAADPAGPVSLLAFRESIEHYTERIVWSGGPTGR